MDDKDESAKLEVPAHLAELVDAVGTADKADAIEVVHPKTGEVTKHLNVRMTVRETKQIMALPPNMRAALAESILAARADKKLKRERATADELAVRTSRKKKAKQTKRSKRRNR